MFKPGDIALEINSSLGGRSAILAHGNKNLTVHCIEPFAENSLKNEFDNMSGWVREQLVDLSKHVEIDKEEADKLLTFISKDFDIDPSGKLVWKRIAGKFPNVVLENNYNLKDFSNWSTLLDLCFINVYENPLLNEHIEFWSRHVKQHGYIAIRMYGVKPAVNSEINLLLEQGWKIIEQADTLILIQKP